MDFHHSDHQEAVSSEVHDKPVSDISALPATDTTVRAHRYADTYGAFYLLNPERFDTMHVGEFVNLADRYGALQADIEHSRTVVDHHEAFIKTLNQAEGSRDMSVLKKVETYEYGIEGSAESFAIGRLVRALSEGREENVAKDANDRQHAVISQLSHLSDSFAVSPQEKIAGYRRLIDDYWLAEARAVLERREAARDTFIRQYVHTNLDTPEDAVATEPTAHQKPTNETPDEQDASFSAQDE